MDMPIYMFWELYRNISRILSETDIRMLSIVGSAFGGADKLYKGLVSERGDIFTQSKTQISGGYDKNGMNRLKTLMGG